MEQRLDLSAFYARENRPGRPTNPKALLALWLLATVDAGRLARLCGARCLPL